MSGEETHVTPHDEAELFRALTRFYRALDVNDVKTLAGYMHSESLWRRQGRELRSGDDIAAALNGRDPRLYIFHLLTSVTFDARSSDHVVYSGYLTVLRAYADPTEAERMAPRGAQSLHVCNGEFRREAGAWRICLMDAGPPRLLIDIAGDQPCGSPHSKPTTATASACSTSKV